MYCIFLVMNNNNNNNNDYRSDRIMKTITITKMKNGLWAATTMSDNGNPLASTDKSKMKALIGLEAQLREEGYYGNIKLIGDTAGFCANDPIRRGGR